MMVVCREDEPERGLEKVGALGGFTPALLWRSFTPEAWQQSGDQPRPSNGWVTSARSIRLLQDGNNCLSLD